MEPGAEIHLTTVSSTIVPDVTVNGIPNMFAPRNNQELIKTESLTNRHGKEGAKYQQSSVKETTDQSNYTNEELESFQLNSITGNVLSLEQEAYGLLKANPKATGKAKSADALHKCPKCPKTYSRKDSLKSHLGVHRTIERRAMGVIRGQQTRKNNLKKKIKNGEYVVGEKLKIKTNKKAVEGKLNINTNAKKDIDSIQLRNSRKKDVVDSIQLRNSRKKDAVDSIQLRNTRKKDVEENIKLRTNTKKDGYECTCGQTFQRRSRLETCLRSHNIFESQHNCVSCMTCTKQFTNKDELALHRKRLHRKRFPCKFCPTDYDTRKELFKHLQIHQKVQLTEYKVISEIMKGKQKLQCFLCSKTWTELSELKIHVMNNHKGPYTCPHCKNTFPKILDFGNHIKTYHPEVEGQSVLDVLEAFSRLVQSWKCEECELQFLEADKLALHQIEKHSPDQKTESQFQCPDCRRVFISQKGLTSHRRIHHSTETAEETKEEEQGIMCLECRKICKDITALTSHMRLHSPERKYPCKFCDFRFATPEKRKAHAEIHTGDMKYVCFICEYQCSSENRLKQHKLSLKHANMKEYLLTGKPLLEEQSTSKEKVKKKEEVKKRKKDKSLEKEKPTNANVVEICCDVCGEKFGDESQMLEHKQTHPFIEIFNDDKPSRIFFK